ncbi:MAG: PmoA family protein [Armatimonadota bacterium]
MRLSLLLALPVVVIAPVLLQGAGAQQTMPVYDMVVTATEAECLEAPVSLIIPSAPALPLLRQVEPPADVPCQAEDVGDRTKLTWIVRDLPKGESREYQLRFSTARLDGDLVSVTEEEDAVEVKIGQDLFTRYLTNAGPKPYCWPVIGPTGEPVTKLPKPGDHPHHRSFWFTHDEVNGVGFWHEGENAGKTVHREFEALVSGPVYGLIRARNDWVAADGTKVCEDVRELRIYKVQSGRLLDFAITIAATEGPVEFGDTKEGTFGLRVAESMEQREGGHIRNSQGQEDGDCWGKQATWVDYYGPVEGETVGIAIMDSPRNFRHPTYWHVRTYGLFAANPFGLRYFIGDKTGKGKYTIPQGESLTLRYRVYIHEGDTEAAKVAEAYAAYAHPPQARLK